MCKKWLGARPKQDGRQSRKIHSFSKCFCANWLKYTRAPRVDLGRLPAHVFSLPDLHDSTSSLLVLMHKSIWTPRSSHSFISNSIALVEVEMCLLQDQCGKQFKFTSQREWKTVKAPTRRKVSSLQIEKSNIGHAAVSYRTTCVYTCMSTCRFMLLPAADRKK